MKGSVRRGRAPAREYLHSLTFRARKRGGLQKKIMINRMVFAEAVFYFFFALAFFAPYFERACILPLTPCASSVPRMMW